MKQKQHEALQPKSIVDIGLNSNPTIVDTLNDIFDETKKCSAAIRKGGDTSGAFLTMSQNAKIQEHIVATLFNTSIPEINIKGYDFIHEGKKVELKADTGFSYTRRYDGTVSQNIYIETDYKAKSSGLTRPGCEVDSLWLLLKNNPDKPVPIRFESQDVHHTWLVLQLPWDRGNSPLALEVKKSANRVQGTGHQRGVLFHINDILRHTTLVAH